MSGFSRVAAALVPLALVTAHAPAETASEGEPVSIGEGHITPFAELMTDGTPRAIGLKIAAAALDGLPAERNATSRCYDGNGDGTYEAGVECEGDTERRLPLPVAGRPDVPFKWAMVNWQAHGHPPAPWSVPHFDIHFYMIPEAEVDAIAIGPCDFFIDCAVRERALKPLPEGVVHPDHVSVGATIGQMGDHLIDSKTPELGDQGVPFTHTWIFGAYDGRIIFHEVMVTRDHLLSGESGCHPVKQPTVWQAAGWYPTRYCVEYDDAEKAHTVSMQNFVLRDKQLSLLNEGTGN